VAEALAGVGELDHLVYTAGDSVAPRPLEQVSMEEARSLFDVRFWGAVAAVKHAAPRIRAGGSVVLTSGTIGVRPAAGAALVAGGSAAIEGLTRGLAVELAPVRVNAVRPGAIRTPLWDAVPEPRRTAVLGALAERTITKTVGQPDQIAAAHLYLMDNHFVTGTVLTVDGGAILI
jgi:NAD(P)-dependent dehydrogenase (short-subunit alcohol dehydrogenase family)